MRVSRHATRVRRSRATLAEKAVPHSPYGEEVLRVRRILLEALAQAQDEVVHGTGGGKHVVAPDALEQVLARDDLTGVLGQYFEDHGLLLRELLRFAIPGTGAKGTKIHFVAAKAQHRGSGRRRGAAIPLPAPQDRAYPQQE